MRTLLLLPVLLLYLPASVAKTPWPSDAKKSYVSRCQGEMTAQGLPVAKARAYCICIADGMDAEFGMEEYKAMMAAQPNPNGSPNDRRLYAVFSACQNHLKK